jgi:kynurenine formamidase
VEIREGDVVLFHTGWLKQFAQMGEGEPGLGFPEPGIGVEGARHLAGKGVVAVGADTWALEAIPFEKEAERFPVHQELLTKNGTYILENMNTAALAVDAAYEFMFVLGAPRMAGAVQTIVNPVAIR